MHSHIPSTARHLSRKSSFSSPYSPNLPSFSLLGALEFREVINALQRESNSSTLNTFDRPVSPLSMRHSWLHGAPRSPAPRDALDLEERDPWDDALGVQLGERQNGHPSRALLGDPPLRRIPSPIISITPADSPTASPPTSPSVSPATLLLSSQVLPTETRRQRLLHYIADASSILFPTLQALQKKTFPSKLTSIVAAPAVFLLTITVPVILAHEQHETFPEPKAPALGQPIDVEQEGMYQVLETEAELRGDIEDIPFNQWLAVAQCILGPLFCAAALFGTSEHALYWYLGSAVVGVSAAALLLLFSENGQDAPTRVALCLMGFCVAMVWIMAIADEVVRVLQVCRVFVLCATFLCKLY